MNSLLIIYQKSSVCQENALFYPNCCRFCYYIYINNNGSHTTKEGVCKLKFLIRVVSEEVKGDGKGRMGGNNFRIDMLYKTLSPQELIQGGIDFLFVSFFSFFFLPLNTLCGRIMLTLHH